MDDTASVSSSSDGSHDEGTESQTMTGTTKEEELVTLLQLRLSASHLPKIGGKRVAFAKRSPNTFATVASIVKRSRNPTNHHFRASSSSCQSPGSTAAPESAMTTSFSNLPGLDDDFMVEWGSTEM